MVIFHCFLYVHQRVIPNDLKTQKTCEPWMHNSPLGPTAKHLAQVRAKVGSGPQSILQAEVEPYTEAVLKIAKDGTTHKKTHQTRNLRDKFSELFTAPFATLEMGPTVLCMIVQGTKFAAIRVCLKMVYTPGNGHQTIENMRL